LIYSNGFLRLVYSDLQSSGVICGRPVIFGVVWQKPAIKTAINS